MKGALSYQRTIIFKRNINIFQKKSNICQEKSNVFVNKYQIIFQKYQIKRMIVQCTLHNDIKCFFLNKILSEASFANVSGY